MNYYNEFEPYAAQWLRNLIDAGRIPAGHVDTRSINNVTASDLDGFTQCHFFAGLGGWSHALRLAGWPDDRPVWTGSCPCQPFSAAGKGAGADDARHLWPDWFRLIRECRPVAIFGEQVGAAIRHGWLDLVSADLEGVDYSIGAAVMGAHSVGAPHIRQRLYWVADADHKRLAGQHALLWPEDIGRLTGQVSEIAGGSDIDKLGDAEREGFPGFFGHGDNGNQPGREHTDAARSIAAPSGASFWSGCDWLPCSDGKARPVEPGTFPLAHGVSGRVGRLRAYGNAIVPQVAQAFIEEYINA